ncbi:hypothetical protein EDC19_1394 [Natranaerovirga hydrolytica]|uniref:Uncharacterized protein n=1 Tax=Natranaerovirga hydrolytica TaxID=680378 RepID=A0A4R1MPH4_9FIRM|nr:hypothetical protein [Natranaerovirga hydrolytica]TCK93204.1 hypothetical protein EDC19_1394 [Natranaerovirga hydrolytica]
MKPKPEEIDETEYIIIDGSNYKEEKWSAKMRTIYFALNFPRASLKIGEVKSGKKNISTNAVRFTTNDLGLTENEEREGSQINALRHTLWQATITKEFNPVLAAKIGYAPDQKK